MCVLAVGKHELTHSTGGGGGPAGERAWVKEQYDKQRLAFILLQNLVIKTDRLQQNQVMARDQSEM